MSEHAEQVALMDWASMRSSIMPELAYLFSVPNGGKRPHKTAVDLQRSGLKAGVPDLFLPVARGRYHGFWIELKTRSGRVTEHQDRWLKWLAAQGYYAEVCYSWEEAAGLIELYMGVPVEQRTEFFK